MKFSDKVAVIHGGNSGIGLAAAAELARQGARVVLGGRNEESLAEAQRRTGAELALVCDIADTAALDDFYARVRERCGRIDVLLVNAGIGSFAPAREVTEELWDSMHGVNLRGAFFAAQKALALMESGSAIVFTGSVASVLGKPGNCVYASSKAGLKSVMRNLAAELVHEGIRVNMVSPGPTDTPIIQRAGVPEDQIGQLRQRMSSVVPMKRMGQPEEIAAAMLFLASADASFITGQELFVDGGCSEIAP